VSNTVFLVIVVGIIALFAVWMGRTGGDEKVSAPPDSGIGEPDEADDDDAPPDEHAPDAKVPVTSEGVALVAAGHQVRLVDLNTPEEMPGWLESGIRAGEVPYREVARVYARSTEGGRGHWSGSTLHAADFTAARVRRDASGGWHLETLGRDGDFGFMPFDTERAAREAHEILEEASIVQRPLDDDGQSVPPSSEDFEEARRRYEETERDLALSGDDDEPPRPADWSSRR